MSNQKWKRPNALKHGVFAATAILPGEDRREFEELHTSLIKEWQPEGPTEEDTVKDLAKLIWRKDRLQRLLQIQLTKNSLDQNHSTYDEELALKVFANVVAQTPETAFEEWTRCLRPERTRQLLEKCPRAKFKTPAEWVAAVVDEINSLMLETIVPVPEILQVDRLGASASLFSDDLLKQELILDGHLSALIDRAVKRLVQIKAMKQMLAAAQINRSGVRSKNVDRLDNKTEAHVG
jgi:hypothetical protein